MRRTWIALAIATLLAVPGTASTTRTLEDALPAAEVEQVVIEVGVGDVEVTARDGDTVFIHITLKPRRGGLFSSMRRAEREVEMATLRSEVKGTSLRLKVESDSNERRFEEHWTIELPDRLSLDLELGVGDVEIRGMSGGLKIEAGVSDMLVEATSGDVTLELGVGDATVRAPAHAYRSATCTGGVGDARLEVRGERISSEGFVGHSASWTGDGDHTLKVEVGVGDANVKLE
jgi:hypothetical protein